MRDTLPLVSVDWLFENLNNPDLIILDGSITKVTNSSEAKNTNQIPNARFFDIKTAFSDVSNRFPNAVPSETQFTSEAQKLGIEQDSFIVVYDDVGIYSSARVWYLLKSFGHENVAVLDGGLPEWTAHNYPVEEKITRSYKKGNFVGNYDKNHFKFFNDILDLQSSSDHCIIDARSNDRFLGLIEEPREGLRSGHIPNSKNLPYKSLLNGNCMKPVEELASIFKELQIKERSLVFTCGSGVTACILLLAAELCQYKSLSVYDGSWTEYGSLT